MFVSHRLAEFADPILVPDPDYKSWSFVAKTRLEPWFHVTTVRPFEHDTGSEVILIATAEMLKAFLETFDETYKPTSIQVVTPGWLNGSQEWKMEHLSELWENEDLATLRYTTRDGNHYFFPGASGAPQNGYVNKIYQAA